MDNRANVEQAVFDFLRPQLKRYREDCADLARSCAASVAKVNQHAEDVVSQRRRQLTRAQEALARCQAQEGADCSGFRRRVEECERALERAVQGRELIRQASTRFHHQQSKHSTVVDQLLLRAQKLVRTADEKTSGYQQGSQYIPRASTISAARRRSGGSSLSSTIASTSPAGAGRSGGGEPTGGGGRRRARGGSGRASACRRTFRRVSR